MSELNSALNGEYECSAIKLLIPWYLNNTLDQQESRQVRLHIDHCSVCQQDYKSQLNILSSIKQSDARELKVKNNFEMLRKRIHSEKTTSSASMSIPVSKLHSNHYGNWKPLLAAAMITSIAVGLLFLSPSEDMNLSTQKNLYKTLSSPQPAGGGQRVENELIIVFKEGTSSDQINAISREYNLNIIESKENHRIFEAHAAHSTSEDQDIETIVSQLRKHAVVKFAEPALQKE